MKRNGWIFWLKVLAGVTLTLLIFQQIERRDSIITALQDANWVNISLCLLLLIPNLLLAFAKWRYLLKTRFPDITAREVFGSLMFGYALGMITPGRLGELARGFYLRGRDRVTSAGLNIFDKAANQIIVFTLGLAALVLMRQDGGLVNASWLPAVLWPAAAVLLLLWALVLQPARLAHWGHWVFRRFQPRRTPAWSSAFQNLRRRDSLMVMFLSLIWYLLVAVQYHILVNAFTTVSLWYSLQAVMAAQMVKTLLPFTFGDLGIREGIAVFFYGQFAVSPAAVFNSALLIFIINFLLPGLAGLYHLFRIKGAKGWQEEPAGSFAQPAYPLSGAPLVESPLRDD